MEQASPPVPYRFWVDTAQRVVSFHPVEGAQLIEFWDRSLFLQCVDNYARQCYRYQ